MAKKTTNGDGEAKDVRPVVPLRDVSQAAALTADTLRATALRVADEIRSLGKQAHTEAVQLQNICEEAAQAVTEVMSEIADRVGAYMQRAAEATDVVKRHCDRLSALPDNKDAARVDTFNAVAKEIEALTIPAVEPLSEGASKEIKDLEAKLIP